MLNRWPQRVLGWADTAFPVVMALFLLSLTNWGTQNDPPLVQVCTQVAGLVAGGALYWRRSRPGLVMVINLAAGILIQTYAPEGLFPFPALVALWAFTARRPVLWSLPALAGVIGLTLLVMPSELFIREDVDFAVLMTVVVWALAFAFRSHRLMVEQSVARLAVENQSRLARDIHDVIAHSVSVIVVQAAAADDVFETRPDRAREALRSIESTGRDALTELRHLLAVAPADSVASPHQQTSASDNRLLCLKTRQPHTTTAPETASRPTVPPTPQPTLERIRPDIIEPLAGAGLEVQFAVEGEVSGVSLGLQLTAFRIVQESLTNVLRHGQGAAATVLVKGEKGELGIVVENALRVEGTEQGIAGTGRGIAGMRERAALVGGVLEAGPVGEGRFRVAARLPVDAQVRL